MRLVEELSKDILDATNRFAEELESARRLPVYEYHKWWARRYSGIVRLFLIYSELEANNIDNTSPDELVNDLFYNYRSSQERKLVDLFAGGGTIVFEGSRLGYETHGVELNRVAYWILNAANQFKQIDPFQEELEIAIESLSDWWSVPCGECGEDAQIVHTFLGWKDEEGHLQIKMNEIKRERDESASSFYCPFCEEVLEAPPDAEQCPECQSPFNEELEDVQYGATEPYAEEYYCLACSKREVRGVSDRNAEKFNVAKEEEQCNLALPDIPKLNETQHLISKGFSSFDELFTNRQIHTHRSVLSRFADTEFEDISKIVVSDALRSCSYLAQYNPKYRKLTPGFAIKSYWLPAQPVELNPLSYRYTNDGVLFPVGRGNIVSSYRRLHRAAEFANDKGYNFDNLTTYQESAQSWLSTSSDGFDIVFTDPPYADLQYYSDLSLINQAVVCDEHEYRNQLEELKENELTVRKKEDYDKYLAQLKVIFNSLSEKVANDGYLLVTYHHSDSEVVSDVARILRSGGLNLSAVYPVMGESSGWMGNGSKNLCLDLLFVLKNGDVPQVNSPSTSVCKTEADKDIVQDIPNIIDSSKPT